MVLRLCVTLNSWVMERPACFSRYGQGVVAAAAAAPAAAPAAGTDVGLSVGTAVAGCVLLLMLLRLLLNGSTMYFSMYSVALKVGMARCMRDILAGGGTIAAR